MGKLFDDLKSKFGDAKIPDASPGGAVAPEVATNRNPALDAARVDVSAEVQKRKRGRPRADGGGIAGATAGPSADQIALAKIQEGLDRLYRPEAWEPVVALPANVAMAFTGHDHWNIEKDEKRNLASTISAAAQYASIQNPRSLAFTLAAMAIITVYGPRVVKELAMRKEEKKDKKAGDEKESAKA